MVHEWNSPLEPNPSARRFTGMDKALIILALWCLPSALLVAIEVWHRYKANLRIRRLHLDEMFAHGQHAHGQLA